MTETATADLSDDIDEIVQVTTNNNNNNSNLSRLEWPPPDAAANTSPTSLSSAAAAAAALIDESTGQGFTTAPATSDEDDGSDDDDEEEDDSRSYYSISNHTTNTNSNMSVMTNGSGAGGARAARHYGRYSSGSSSSLGPGGVKGEEKRSHHNVLERKRRDLLKDSFSRLRDSVPTTQPRERVSRAEILRQAADYIASTAQKNAGIRAELDELIRKNRELEEKRARDGSSGQLGPDNSTTSTSGVAQKVVDKTEATIKQES